MLLLWRLVKRPMSHSSPKYASMTNNISMEKRQPHTMAPYVVAMVCGMVWVTVKVLVVDELWHSRHALLQVGVGELIVAQVAVDICLIARHVNESVT